MLVKDEKRDILQIIDTYSDTIYKICFVYLKNKFDAEDALQELFIKIYEKAPIFLNEEHEKAWIIRVTINHCKNILRYNYIRKCLAIDENIVAIDNPTNETLQHILKLSLHYRNVLYLYYYEGYSTKEIASILRKKEATIRTWLKRARENLKQIMGDDYEK